MNRIFRIVMLTALIALTLGMTSLPTVLSPKPAYVVTVTVTCSNISILVNTHTLAHSMINFWWKTTVLGYVQVTCTDGVQGVGTAQFTQKPDTWNGFLDIWESDPGQVLCSINHGGTIPETVTINCVHAYPYYHWASVEIA